VCSGFSRRSHHHLLHTGPFNHTGARHLSSCQSFKPHRGAINRSFDRVCRMREPSWQK
jgi:hypothetical protein